MNLHNAGVLGQFFLCLFAVKNPKAQKSGSLTVLVTVQSGFEGTGGPCGSAPAFRRSVDRLSTWDPVRKDPLEKGAFGEYCVMTIRHREKRALWREVLPSCHTSRHALTACLSICTCCWDLNMLLQNKTWCHLELHMLS
jgi:hypothetical protein